MLIKLRPFHLDDLEELVEKANNKKVSDNLTDQFPFPYTREDGENFIKMVMSNDPVHVKAIEFEGEFAGGIGVHPREGIERYNAELGYWLAEEFWGMGIISEAIPQMVKYGFENFNIKRIFARPYPHNIASIKALEKNGFLFEARIKDKLVKNGVVMDELIYAIRK